MKNNKNGFREITAEESMAVNGGFFQVVNGLLWLLEVSKVIDDSITYYVQEKAKKDAEEYLKSQGG
jgi:hypothetical protein